MDRGDGKSLDLPDIVGIQGHPGGVRRQETKGHPSLHKGVADCRVQIVARAPREPSHCPRKAEDGRLFQKIIGGKSRSNNGWCWSERSAVSGKRGSSETQMHKSWKESTGVRTRLFVTVGILFATPAAAETTKSSSFKHPCPFNWYFDNLTGICQVGNCIITTYTAVEVGSIPNIHSFSRRFCLFAPSKLFNVFPKKLYSLHGWGLRRTTDLLCFTLSPVIYHPDEQQPVRHRCLLKSARRFFRLEVDIVGVGLPPHEATLKLRGSNLSVPGTHDAVVVGGIKRSAAKQREGKREGGDLPWFQSKIESPTSSACLG